MKKGRLNKEKLKVVNHNCKILHDIINTNEVFWNNDKYNSKDKKQDIIKFEEVIKADERLRRFAPYIKKVFKKTESLNGIIESRLINIKNMRNAMINYYREDIIGEVYCKCDNELPISGSVKARGGIYEVLKFAEKLALDNGLITENDDYSILDNESFKKFYSNYEIIVASTGNLGLSIGIISSKLGFKVKVYMSNDAMEWKKKLLRSLGAKVIEHKGDYSKAVEVARRECIKKEKCYFIDDENSKELFLGYATAAIRLKEQISALGIVVNEKHPLIVYLPCGVGGAPGGITFGLKHIYGENVHCFFAEPTHAPAMLLGLITEQHEKTSVKKYGIDGITKADGLAVGKPSGFVGRLLKNSIAGIYTTEDDDLYKLLYMAKECENLYLEPSAMASFMGIISISRSDIKKQEVKPTHIVWATGGDMVPKDIWEKYYYKGKKLYEDR